MLSKIPFNRILAKKLMKKTNYSRTIKYIFSIATFLLLISCNNSKGKNTLIEKKEIKKELSSNIVGKWISVNDHIVKDIVISSSVSETYRFKITFKDGSTKNENITLNDKGEYRTNNSFGEYYKMKGDNLVIYDNQGIIAYYER